MITEKKDLHKDDEYAEPRLISHGKINLMICQGTQYSEDDGWQQVPDLQDDLKQPVNGGFTG